VEPLDKLNREELITQATQDRANWWDGLLQAAAQLGAPTVGTASTSPVAKALPLLTSQPHLPAANAEVENRIRHLLEPFLENRKQMDRNLARLNFLLHLATARSQGAFTDLAQVAGTQALRSETASGHCPTRRPGLTFLGPARRTCHGRR
jgi:hypothetical protein